MDSISDGESCVQRDISEEERRALEEGRVKAEGGYDQITTSQGMLGIIDDAVGESASIKHRKSREPDFLKAKGEAGRCGADNFRLTDFISEFPGRWSAVYETKLKKRILLVRNDFYAFGGKHGSFDSALRFSVNGRRATVVLMSGTRGDKRLWLVTWVGDGVSFELNLEDVAVADGQSKAYAVGDVLDIASQLDKECHWKRDPLPRPELLSPPPQYRVPMKE